MVEELPLQTLVGEAAAVPPTEVGLTVTVATVELADGQTPLVTTARKSVVVVRLPVFKVGFVWPAMSAKGLAPVRDCHWIDPTWPPRAMVVPLPLHTVEGVAVAVPPTEVGLTVTVATLDGAGGHTPLVTFARK